MSLRSLGDSTTSVYRVRPNPFVPEGRRPFAHLFQKIVEVRICDIFDLGHIYKRTIDTISTLSPLQCPSAFDGENINRTTSKQVCITAQSCQSLLVANEHKY